MLATALDQLNEGCIARYRLRRSEYLAWQQARARPWGEALSVGQSAPRSRAASRRRSARHTRKPQVRPHASL